MALAAGPSCNAPISQPADQTTGTEAIAQALQGENQSGSNLSGTNLSGVNSGANIHNLGSVSGMLYSGEDVWSTTPYRCVVMGVGSTAFGKLLGQQSANANMYVALGKLPWG